MIEDTHEVLGFARPSKSDSGVSGKALAADSVECQPAEEPAASAVRLTESALRESNPPVQLGRLVPLPLGQGHGIVIQRKPWDSNPQRCEPHLFSRQAPHPAG